MSGSYVEGKTSLVLVDSDKKLDYTREELKFYYIYYQ